MNDSQYYLFSADFETTIAHESKCSCKKPCFSLSKCPTQYTQVWLAGLYDVKKKESRIFTSIDEFMDVVFDVGYDFVKVFFHNLKFDGSFLVHYLYKNNINFESHINDMGSWFSLTVNINNKKIIFKDFMKVITQPLVNFPAIFGFETFKGETPLLVEPPEKIESEWVDYIKKDVEILGLAVEQLYLNEGFEKDTAASQAFAAWDKTQDMYWRLRWPVLPIYQDQFIRKAYKGGYVYLNDKYKEKIVDHVKYIDINSAHPYNMMFQYLPYGYPRVVSNSSDLKGYMNRKYDKRRLFIIHVRMSFDLKDGFLPTLQFKDRVTCDVLGVKSTDYVKSSFGKVVDVFLTSVDWGVFVKHYDYIIDKYVVGYFFDAIKGGFSKFLSVRRDIKQNPDTSKAKRTVVKLESNSLYGKFGARTFNSVKKPVIVDDILKYLTPVGALVRPVFNSRGKVVGAGGGVVKPFISNIDGVRFRVYDLGSDFYYREVYRKERFEPCDIVDEKGEVQVSMSAPKFTATAAFVTAYTRRMVIEVAQQNYERFIYADTDSIQLEGFDDPVGVEIDSYDYGKWAYEGDHEGCFLRGKYLRSKLYVLETLDGVIDVKGAGMSGLVKSQVTFDNFEIGATYIGKKAMKQVRGGAVIMDMDFTVHEGAGLMNR